MSKALIVSYCWTQDAERLGALINPDNTTQPEVLPLVFRDLAAVHGVDVEWIEEQYEAHFAWDWLHDPLTMGLCFVLFFLHHDGVLALLNGHLRCICVLWPGCVRKKRHL